MNKILRILSLSLFSLGTIHASDKPIPVTMQLDWIFNAQFSGLYQAIEQGYYLEEGLEVTLVPAPPQIRVVDATFAHEGIAFGSSESNLLLAARAQGDPVKALATMFQGSPMGWMSLKSSGIESFEDLAGKSIGIHADGEKVIKLVTREQNVGIEDFELPKVGYDPVIIANGEVTAMQCYVIDEFVKLQLMTNNGGSILMASDFGYHAYSQVIFTSDEVVENYPEVVRSFLLATQKGWSYALDNQEATVDLILSQYNPELDREYQLASLAEIEKLVRPDGAAPLAPMNPEVWATSQKQFLANDLLESPADLEALLDFRFNP